MGSYTDNLTRRCRKSKVASLAHVEHLVAVAIIRDGVTESRGCRSHYELRRMLGDAHPLERRRDDEEGFLTSTGRFLDRDEAAQIGEIAGQCQRSRRELLSSDITWAPRA